MVRTVTLAVQAAAEKPGKTYWIDIYRITEGDHIWNTLVADRTSEDGFLNFSDVHKYLQDCASVFASEHASALRFSSQEHAQTFSAKLCRIPVNVRGFPYAIRYPGS